ncbi:MAG: hypothetical protein HYS83_00790 [Candidatus Blackburnbacteria bacterium]|nr:hypothetical protein [Candidatus Blackburnbacteria bacterium]
MTLTETAYYTRAAIKYSIFFALFLIVARLFWEVGLGAYRKFYPEPPPPPTVSFGKLPKLPFLDKKDSSGFTFSLQTPTGEFPKFPTTLNVYFMPQREVSFLDLDEAAKLARLLGFSGKMVNLLETIYRFEKDGEPANIDMNIVNKTFSLNYNLAATPELLSFRPRSTDDALRTVISLLSQGNLFPDDLEKGEKSFGFLKPQAREFVEVPSLSEANFVRVNFFRANYDNLPVLTPDKNIANTWFLVGADRSGGSKLIGGEYHYFAADKGNSSTYPVKTADTAWEELKNGRGFIISQPESTKEITIRRVYLAYYDSGEPQGFLQPIVVFEGDRDFVAYLPAVTDEFYGGN